MIRLRDVLPTLPGVDHPDDCRCGICHCGCGQVAPISDRTRRASGYVKGEPHRFAHGHGARGPKNRNWKGGRYTDSDGYVKVKFPHHPRAVRGYVYEHVLIAEAALGHRLPDGVEIHHVNEIKSDNRPANLVICPDHGYHMLLHQRRRALDECGDANLMKCAICKEYDRRENLSFSSDNLSSAGVHVSCRQERQRTRYAVKRLPCAGCSRKGPHKFVRETGDGWEAYCADCSSEMTS